MVDVLKDKNMSKHLPRLVKIITDHPKRWSGLQDEIRRFDLALATAPDEIPDKCKTLAEIVLKTILVDSGEKTDVECDSMDMEGLKVCVCQKLSLISTEDLLIKAELTYINSTRNDFGVTCHGRSLLRQSTAEPASSWLRKKQRGRGLTRTPDYGRQA